jgi:cytochrome d ubiquinol oxidase subunit II
MLEAIPLVLIVAGIAAYSVLAGADFGAGIWNLLGGHRREEVREYTHRAMAPVWEANHVWLIFVLVVCWTAYPEAFGAIFSTLYVPLFLAAIGIIIRGASYALHGWGQRAGPERLVNAMFIAGSILTPFCLGATIGAIASGRVPAPDQPAGDPWDSWLAPVPILVGALAVATAAYLAGVYLAGDATRAGRRDLAEAFRVRALGAGVVAGGLAIAGLLVVRDDARQLYNGLTEEAGLVAVLVSGLAGVATLALVVRRRYEPARFSAAVAVAAIVAGWPLSQSPDFLPGLTLDEAAASDSVLVALLVTVAIGALVLIPSLTLLYRLVLSGRFDPVLPEERAEGSRRRASRGAGSDVGTGAQGPPVALVAVLAVAGPTLTFFTEGGIGRIAGILCLFAGMAAVAARALAPGRVDED